MKLVLLFSFASEGNSFKEVNVLLKSLIVIEGAEWWVFLSSKLLIISHHVEYLLSISVMDTSVLFSPNG